MLIEVKLNDQDQKLFVCLDRIQAMGKYPSCDVIVIGGTKYAVEKGTVDEVCDLIDVVYMSIEPKEAETTMGVPGIPGIPIHPGSAEDMIDDDEEDKKD